MQKLQHQRTNWRVLDFGKWRDLNSQLLEQQFIETVCHPFDNTPKSTFIKGRNIEWVATSPNKLTVALPIILHHGSLQKLKVTCTKSRAIILADTWSHNPGTHDWEWEPSISVSFGCHEVKLVKEPNNTIST